MKVLCPKHNVELEINQGLMPIYGNQYWIAIGSCPHCTTKYTNRTLFGNAEICEVEGIRYQFLPSLGNAYPFKEVDQDRARAREQVKQREIEKQLKAKVEAELRRQKEEQQREEEKVKREKAKAKQEQLKRQAEQRKLEQKQRYMALVEKYTKNPYLQFRATQLIVCPDPVDYCLKDGQELCDLSNIRILGIKQIKGKGCVKCRYAYISKNEYEQIASALQKAESDHTDIEAHNTSKIDNGQVSRTRQPGSAILQANIRTSKKQKAKQITIVADEKEQHSDDGVFWVGRAFPTMILMAIAMELPSFTYNSIQHTVISYHTYSLAEKYFNIITRFCNPETPHTIYVFAHKNVHQFNSPNYEMVTAMIPCANASFPIPTTVYFEKSTDRYFINETQYILLRKQYGLPYLKLRPAPTPSGNKSFASLKAHSELYLIGYNVNMSDGPTAKERRTLLSKILDNGILSKAEIVNHIEWLINTRSCIESMENAVCEWTADLNYVLNYQSTNQRTILASAFKSKYSDFG